MGIKKQNLCKICLQHIHGHHLSQCIHIRSVQREGAAPFGPALELPEG